MRTFRVRPSLGARVHAVILVPRGVLVQRVRLRLRALRDGLLTLWFLALQRSIRALRIRPTRGTLPHALFVLLPGHIVVLGVLCGLRARCKVNRADPFVRLQHRLLVLPPLIQPRLRILETKLGVHTKVSTRCQICVHGVQIFY